MKIGIFFVFLFLSMTYILAPRNTQPVAPLVGRAALFDLPPDTKLVSVNRSNSSLQFDVRARRSDEIAERYTLALHEGKKIINDTRPGEAVTSRPVIKFTGSGNAVIVDEHQSNP